MSRASLLVAGLALLVLTPLASALPAAVRLDGQGPGPKGLSADLPMEDLDLVCDRSPNMRFPEECDSLSDVCDLELPLPWCSDRDHAGPSLPGLVVPRGPPTPPMQR